jgi:hypothetical protein
MASSPDTSDWHKRYAVIEKAYCQGRWSTVMEAGTLLLRELQEAGAHPEVMALRHRMQLLMAHTLLHGYGDRDAAEDLYEVVRQSDAEAALRQIAEDGLDQCHQPLNSTMVVEEDEEEDPQHSRPKLFLPETERNDLQEEDPSVPSRAASSASQIPLKPLQRISPEPRPEPAQAPQPQAFATPLAQPAPAPIPPEATNLGLAADPFGPAGGSPPSEPKEGEAPVMPWLTQPSEVPVGGSMEQALPWKEQTPTALAPLNQALIPEVVDEPELIEVHQANPSLAEEVDLQIQRDTPAFQIHPAPPEPKEPGINAPSREDDELRAGLLLVVLG